MNEKWFNNYIYNIDLSKIEWIKLNKDELNNFYEENYFDKSEWCYITNEDESTFLKPLGLHYLCFDNGNKDYSFLLGIVKNNIGKKTIVAAMMYLENYCIFSDQKVPLTYISSVETNLFFRNKGIYSKMCEIIIDYINSNQHIIISKESKMGKEYNVVEKMKKSLIENGFEKTIWIDDYLIYGNSNFWDIIELKQKVLKKVKNKKEYL